MAPRGNTSLVAFEAPEIDAGAPAPVMVADEDELVFAYWMAGNVGVRSAVVRVGSYRVFKFGYPNEEALAGHRYYSLGLSWYQAHEVLNSDWITEMTAANRVHSQHSDSLFSHLRHFVFVFHDTVLEFVSGAAPEIEVRDGPPAALVAAASARKPA